MASDTFDHLDADLSDFDHDVNSLRSWRESLRKGTPTLNFAIVDDMANPYLLKPFGPFN